MDMNTTIQKTIEAKLRWFFVMIVALLMTVGTSVTPAIHAHASVHETHAPTEHEHHDERDDSDGRPNDCDDCRRIVATISSISATPTQAVSMRAVQVDRVRPINMAGPPTHARETNSARGPPMTGF
jgi:hypothetical protein